MKPIERLCRYIDTSPFDAVLIPGTDPHQSEYPPDEWQLRAYFTEFTGSFGHVVCTAKRGFLTTDSRYTLQAAEEVDAERIDHQIISRADSFSAEINWALENSQLKNLAIDPRLVNLPQWEQIQTLSKQHDFKIHFLDDGFLAEVWPERPAPKQRPILLRPPGIDSLSRQDKLAILRDDMGQNSIDLQIISDLESIARTLNIIGFDAGYDLLAVSYLVIDPQSATLFIDPNKVKDSLESLNAVVQVIDYQEFANTIASWSQNKTVLLDPKETSLYVKTALAPNSVLQFKRSLATDFKQIKSLAEIDHIKQAHVEDAIALAEAFSRMEELVLRGETISEFDVGEELTKERKKRDGFLQNSFSPIVGYQENGAIVHYRAPQSGCKSITAEGSVLIDSGGHYSNGTTDITRTLALGETNEVVRQRYTQVLKGHLAVNRVKFRKEWNPSHLEMLARAPLLQDGLEYGHGTGHGVGYGTAVHEESEASLTLRNQVSFQEGWVISNEPGYYETGAFGIRIENLIAVKNYSEELFEFQQLTCFPYEPELIVLGMLDNGEIRWLNQYHQWVLNNLSGKLSEGAQTYIAKRCQPLPLH